MKEEVEGVDVMEEDVVGWTTSFLGVLLVEEVVEDVEEVDVELLVVVGVEVVELVELVVSVFVSSTCTGVGDGEGVGVGVGVGVGEGDTLLSLLSLLFEVESVPSGVAAAVMYPPTGPSNVLAAVW